MAQVQSIKQGEGDAFSPIANYYDAIMEHVDYDRWHHIAIALAEMLPRPFLHLDAGCGTGVLMERLSRDGWYSTGMDLSPTMLRVARHRRKLPFLAQADLRALPFQDQFHIITCLFDSLNFLLQEDQVRQALQSFGDALTEGGVLYFDIVTKRMITDHFNNESWLENHGRFRSAWHSSFDRSKQLCETRVRINSGEESVTRERVYPPEFFRDAVKEAGLKLLSMRDAYTWKAPGRRSTRIDFIAVKGNGRDAEKQFRDIEQRIMKRIQAT